MGFDVAEAESTPPDRKGKGGPKKMLYSISRAKAELNERNAANARKKKSGGKSRKKP